MELSIPVIRIDDYKAAKEFYVNWLGFEVQWEWRHKPEFPIYMEVKRGNLRIHLTEHRDDCNGKGTVYSEVENVNSLYAELVKKKPGFSGRPQAKLWGNMELELVDPFENKLRFSTPSENLASI